MKQFQGFDWVHAVQWVLIGAGALGLHISIDPNSVIGNAFHTQPPVISSTQEAGK